MHSKIVEVGEEPDGAGCPAESLGCLTAKWGGGFVFGSSELGSMGGLDTTTAGGAAQNRIVVGCSKMCFMRAQLSFAMGIVTMRPQQIRQTMSMRGAMMEMNASQKQILPRISLVVVCLAAPMELDDDSGLGRDVAPYDFEGVGKWDSVRCRREVCSSGMGFHDTV